MIASTSWPKIQQKSLISDNGYPQRNSYRIDFFEHMTDDDEMNDDFSTNSPVFKTRDCGIVLDNSKRVKLLALGDVIKVGHGAYLPLAMAMAKKETENRVVVFCVDPIRAGKSKSSKIFTATAATISK